MRYNNLPYEHEWFPLSFIPMFSLNLDQLLEEQEGHHEFLQKIKNNYIELDEESLDEIVAQYYTMSGIISLNRLQIDKWQKEPLSIEQQTTLKELESKLLKVTFINDKILTIIKNLHQNIAGKILEQKQMNNELLLNSLQALPYVLLNAVIK